MPYLIPISAVLLAIVAGIQLIRTILAMCAAAAEADDKAQARICPDCAFNQERCEWNPRRCKYAKSKTS